MEISRTFFSNRPTPTRRRDEARTHFYRRFREYKYTDTQNNNNNGIEAKRQNKGKGTSNVICNKRLVTRIL